VARGILDVMPTFVLSHHHRPEECAIAAAAWRGFASPLRHCRPLASCARGGHGVWWTVQADNSDSALAQLPDFVARRTVAEEVCEVVLP
jgi:hypothetical protein